MNKLTYSLASINGKEIIDFLNNSLIFKGILRLTEQKVITTTVVKKDNSSIDDLVYKLNFSLFYANKNKTTTCFDNNIIYIYFMTKYG